MEQIIVFHCISVECRRYDKMNKTKQNNFVYCFYKLQTFGSFVCPTDHFLKSYRKYGECYRIEWMNHCDTHTNNKRNGSPKNLNFPLKRQKKVACCRRLHIQLQTNLLLIVYCFICAACRATLLLLYPANTEVQRETVGNQMDESIRSEVRQTKTITQKKKKICKSVTVLLWTRHVRTVLCNTLHWVLFGRSLYRIFRTHQFMTKSTVKFTIFIVLGCTHRRLVGMSACVLHEQKKKKTASPVVQTLWYTARILIYHAILILG